MNHDQTVTLYDKIGDEKLRLLVETFYSLVQQNEILSPLFKGDFITIKDKQYCFLTQFLGGPMRYTEKYGVPKMRMRHLPHAIDQRAKEEWLKCMRKAIDSIELEEHLGNALYNCFPAVAAHMVNR